jgi:hypothetical protein
VRPGQWQKAKDKLTTDFDFQTISFDELLLRHLHLLCDGMAKPPNWQVVLKADAADHSSMDWSRLQGLVQRALAAMADEVKAVDRPVLLTDPGLIARYELVDSWLSELRSHLLNGQQVNGQQVNALVLLIANETTTAGAIIDGITIPSAERGRQQRVCAYPERLA